MQLFHGSWRVKKLRNHLQVALFGWAIILFIVSVKWYSLTMNNFTYLAAFYIPSREGMKNASVFNISSQEGLNVRYLKSRSQRPLPNSNPNMVNDNNGQISKVIRHNKKQQSINAEHIFYITLFTCFRNQSKSLLTLLRLGVLIDDNIFFCNMVNWPKESSIVLGFTASYMLSQLYGEYLSMFTCLN